jgi:hypothetical protein
VYTILEISDERTYPFGDTAAADPPFSVPKPGIAGMPFPKCFDCLTGFGDEAASGI